MTSFTRDWTTGYEGQPADNENINLGASRIRNLKVDLRQRLQVDHAFGDNGPSEADDGKHLQVTFLVRTTAPGLDAGSGALYSQIISSNVELVWKDVAGHILQLTSGGALLLPSSYTFTGVTTTSLVVTANASVGGDFGVNGTATLGALTVNNDAEIVDTLTVLGDINSVGPIAARGGVTLVNNDPYFFFAPVSGVPTAGFANGAHIDYNAGAGRFDFYIGTVLVGHIP